MGWDECQSRDGSSVCSVIATAANNVTPSDTVASTSQVHCTGGIVFVVVAVVGCFHELYRRSSSIKHTNMMRASLAERVCKL